jgi:peroxiredoxin
MANEKSKNRKGLFGFFRFSRKKQTDKEETETARAQQSKKSKDEKEKGESPAPEKKEETPKEKNDGPLTLQDEIDAFVEKIIASVTPDVLELMKKATLTLVESDITKEAIKTGDAAPAFTLPDAEGALVSSEDLYANGPLILTFYRGAWCPYCNMQLVAYEKYLEQFKAAGATLVAISPNLPDFTQAAVDKNDLKFPVLSDVKNVVAKQFQLVYQLDESLRPIYNAWGFDIPGQNGDDTYEIPLAATYIIDASGNVIYSFVDADYTKRAEPADLLAALSNATE